MKQVSTEELIKNYYEQKNADIDTEGLLKKLKPVVQIKCKELKDKKENWFETLIFTLTCIVTFVMGIFFLFPEVIDYTDTVIQFLIVGFIAGFVLITIDIVATGLMTKGKYNKNIKLRGNLL